MADSFGLKIGLEGEKEFKKAVNNLNRIHFLDNNFSNLSIYMKKNNCYKSML